MGRLLNKLIGSSTSQTSLTDIYRVDNSQKEVRMKLDIGAPGQTSLSKVKLGKTVLLDDHDGPVANLVLDTNSLLNGRFLTIKTVVTDIKGKPDDTAVDFTLTGGPDGKYNFILSRKVTADGDSVFYEIEIFFFN
jgi:hypothetical protein